MNKFSVKEIAIKYNLIAKKSLGQNFLFDQNLTDKIAKSANLHSEDIIVEVGPGPGGLTNSILKQNIRKLTVIEPDIRCIEALTELKNIYPNILNIVEGDALKINIEDIATSGVKIISNLPYNIATVLAFKWLENINYFTSLTLMFQKEVASRIIAKARTKEYGRLSVMMQSFCDITHIFDIPPDAFVPRPKITSSVICIKPHNRNNEVNQDKLSKLCKVAFNQRRKFLKSTIKSLIPNIEEVFTKLQISLTARPEELSVEQFCSLSHFIE